MTINIIIETPFLHSHNNKVTRYTLHVHLKVHVHLCFYLFSMQYIYYCCLLALLSTAVYIRLNWLFKGLITLVGLIVYLYIILGPQSCLYDNYDRRILGYCVRSYWFFELKYKAAILLSVSYFILILLGRHVSQ